MTMIQSSKMFYGFKVSSEIQYSYAKKMFMMDRYLLFYNGECSFYPGKLEEQRMTAMGRIFEFYLNMTLGGGGPKWMGCRLPFSFETAWSDNESVDQAAVRNFKKIFENGAVLDVKEIKSWLINFARKIQRKCPERLGEVHLRALNVENS